ncbi:MAG: transposase [Nanoarchaeota archaeon]|nr:transposase [Nanoarchaeota archaeon]
MVFIRKIKVGEKVYLAEVKSYRENGKIRQKFIRYLGREVNGKAVKRVLTSDIQATNVKQSLDVLAIDKIAEELKLKEIPHKPALSLAYSQLLEKRSITKLEDWMRYTEIPDVLGIALPSVKELYESLADINEEDFDKINDEMFSVFESYENIKESAIIDITDTYFSGTNFNIKKRKGKDEKISKLIQIGLAVSFKNGFPIFHKKYHGNLSGIDIFKDMSIELKNKGISSMIMDRGMLSKENIEVALGLKFEIIAGMKKNQNLIKDFILPVNRDEIYTKKYRVKLKNTEVFIKTYDYMKGKLIIVYNPSLEVMKKSLNFNKDLDSASDIGYSLIYHNTKYSSEEVVRNYFDKEMVERAFKHIKGVLNLRPIRVWLSNHIEGHIKICYLAYAILSLMNFKLKKLKISAVDALNSLKHGYKINLKDNSSGFEWSIYVPLEPKQKKILKELGVVVKN